jgi:hypothetical protein
MLIKIQDRYIILIDLSKRTIEHPFHQVQRRSTFFAFGITRPMAAPFIGRADVEYEVPKV